ncbi:MAG: hypothetical protein PVG91_07085 [Gammaproteobacteria bacterium]|jgi:hypothetical protein
MEHSQDDWRHRRAVTIGWLSPMIMLILTAMPNLAAAQQPWSGETLTLRAGAVIMDVDSSFRVDSRSLGEGTTVDAEDDLGLDDSDDVFRAELVWRIAPRHQLSLGYYDLSRDATERTDEAYQIGNVIFPPGISVDTQFDLKLADFSYAFSVVQNERFEFAPQIGVYWLDFDVRVENDLLGLSEGEGQEFPLPTIGARFNYQLAPSWWLRAKGQYFYIEYDQYEGQMLELGAGLEWNVWRKLSLGASYSHIDMDIEDTNANGGKGEYEYDGVWGYLALTF